MLTPLAPADGELVLPLADARVHLRLTGDDVAYDEAVKAARADAISLIEDRTRRSLQSREFSWVVNRFTQSMRLPMLPVGAITGISYVAPDGTSIDLVDGGWRLADDVLLPAAGGAFPLTDSARNSVLITFTAGYATAAEIPALLLLSVKQAMSALFSDRSNPDLSGALQLADKFRRRVL